MAGGAVRNQLRIDLRKGKARPRSLVRLAHDGDDTVYLQSDAQLGGTLRKPRAPASRSDLLARPLTLGCGSYGCGQKDEECTEGVEILRLAHRRPEHPQSGNAKNSSIATATNAPIIPKVNHGGGDLQSLRRRAADRHRGVLLHDFTGKSR
jgi:hypothetical protein